jgi:hypothetical protein
MSFDHVGLALDYSGIGRVNFLYATELWHSLHHLFCVIRPNVFEPPSLALPSCYFLDQANFERKRHKYKGIVPIPQRRGEERERQHCE